MAQHDETVLLIERSKQMYGGTCINVGCLPSKNLILNGQRGLDFTTAVNKRGEMTRQLRNKNYHMVADEPLATIWDGSARFIDNYVLAVVMSDGTTKKVRGERIFINTGAVPNWPSIPGLEFGQRPNVSSLGLENTDIALTNRGAIQVDDHLRTTVQNIWALGDVNGGPMFTYVSLDDFRIIIDQLFGKGDRSTADRMVIPTASFLNPPLANVGLNERQAKSAGYNFQTFKLSVKAIPKARVLEDQRGLYKVIVDQKTRLILGATLYAAEAHETINLIALAMKAKLPYERLRDMIYVSVNVFAVAFKPLV